MNALPPAIVSSLPSEFLDQMEIDTENWDAVLTLWEAKAARESPASLAEFHAWQRAFHAKRGEVLVRVSALERYSHHEWGELHASIEQAWGELGTAYESARKRFC